MKDSKKLWISLDKKIKSDLITLGRHTSHDYINDPKHFSIVAARYKFCSRIFEGLNVVIEIGCGDGFGSPIVASTVKQLICTDINETMLEDNRSRNSFLTNVTYEYFDFRESKYPSLVNAIFLVDVIEHIYPKEEPQFMLNLTNSLTSNGIALIGTPNKSAQKNASYWSKKAHVNLKDYKTLRQLCLTYFNNVFMFGMNDEIVHTGFPPMAHFLWALCVTPKKKQNSIS